MKMLSSDSAIRYADQLENSVTEYIDALNKGGVNERGHGNSLSLTK